MNIETLAHPPRTMMEVFEALPEGTNIQLIENNLIMSPAPLDRHQVITGEIYAELLYYVKKNKFGQVRIAPYDVFLDRKNAYQPDISFVLTQHTDQIKRNGLYGVPDLIIEVLSHATAKYDKGEKKDVYERCGVTEYWMIDPEDNLCICYGLTNGQYHEIFRGIGILESKLLGFKIEF